jgi:hypothetical protein
MLWWIAAAQSGPLPLLQPIAATSASRIIFMRASYRFTLVTLALAWDIPAALAGG